MRVTITPFLLTTLALSAGAAATTTLSSSRTVQFIAKPLGSDLNPPIRDYVAAPVWIDGECGSALGLLPPGDATTWAWNGSIVRTVALSPGEMVVQPGGSATVPAARPVGVTECGNAGTPGVGIDSSGGGDDGSVPMLHFGSQGSGWMACPPESLNLGNLEADCVAFCDKGQRVLDGCVEIQLLAKCVEQTADDNVGGDALEILCYRGL